MIYENRWRTASNDLYKHFCAYCVLCVLTGACAHYLMFVYTVTILKSQTGKNNQYCLMCEALLNNKKF